MSFSPKILVCGCGSVGRRHIANLKNLGCDVFAWRSRSNFANELSEELGIMVEVNLREAIKKADAVVIATASDQHFEPLRLALSLNKPVFVEKPLLSDLSGLGELESLVEDGIVEVGCQLRVHPAIRALKAEIDALPASTIYSYRFSMGHRLDHWRPGQDYTNSYSASAERGGGALFDLVHQVDLARWIFGEVSDVFALQSSKGTCEVKGDSISAISLRHQSGVVGQILLDMVSPVYKFSIEVITEEAVFELTKIDGDLLKLTPGTSTRISDEADSYDRNALFVVHMQHFLCRIKDSSIAPVCSFQEGIDTLKLLLSTRESAFRGICMRIGV